MSKFAILWHPTTGVCHSREGGNLDGGQKELDSCFRRKDKLRKLRTRSFWGKRYCNDLSKFEL